MASSAFPEPISGIKESLLDATGDILYASADNTPVRLGIGTTGQVLSVSGGVPAWTTPSGGGKVLQVVTANTTTYAQNNTNSYVDTALTASITPTLNTSKVLILVQQGGIFINSGSQSNACSLRLLRGATALSDMYNIALHAYTGNLTASAAMNYLDSPATTSSTTYKTQWANPGNLSYTTCQDSGSTSTITLLEIGA
jgi:hypothetical protein